MADLDKLTAPFPKHAIKQRRVGGGRMLDYVEGHTVIHRLNDATGNEWDFRVVSLDRLPLGTDASLMTATVELCLPGHGCRQHIGVQMVHANGGEDLVKGAITDALKKAATLFGVGLELYGPDYEAGEVPSESKAATRSAAPQRPKPVEPVSHQGHGAQNAPGRNGGASGAPERTPGGASMRSLTYSLVLAEEAGVSDDDVHRWTGDQFGKVSRNDLDQRQMSRLIDWLQECKATAPPADEPADLDHDAAGNPLSWTGFWTAAREHGVTTPAEYEARVGAKQTAYRSPAEALAALVGSEQPA